MNFDEFERLESFNVLMKKIEELSYSQNSSLKGPSDIKSGGLSIKNDGSYKRE